MNNKLIFVMVFLLTLFGCVSKNYTDNRKNSPLTQGNIQMTIITGKTNKLEVLESFGAPNITTRDGAGREVWTYQRAAQVSKSSSSHNYFSILLLTSARNVSGFESGSRMVTLIIKFDKNDVVSDFRSRTSNF